MKFLSIYLSNYIGIYNGMGLYDIHIDMTKCKNRITIIRGDNGSGKSTLSKAMNLFPDPSDSFIPGLPARKEIVLSDGNTGYKLVFIHNVKANGDRDTTKAYITKTFGNSVVELNENGNVTSYKEILYSELGLDANFAALSQLSNDDRGLADKKPAERKRFVNSIISSLDTYNNIYKTLGKRSSNYKSLINAVSSKLSVLGDEATVMSNLEAIENRIKTLQDQKDQAVIALAREQSTISLLDPDGSIQSTNTVISAELDLAEKEHKKIQAIIDSLISSGNINTEDIMAGYRSIVEKKNSYIIDNQICRNTIDGLIAQQEGYAQELAQKLYRLSQLQDGETYESINDKLYSYKTMMDQIRAELYKVGPIDISNISKDEYIIALETLRELESNISTFKSCMYYTVIEEIVNHYICTGMIPEPKNIIPLDIELADRQNELDSLKSKKTIIESRLSLLDKLSLRPDSCSDNTCPFIKDAFEFSTTNPRERIECLDEFINIILDDINRINREIQEAMSYNDSINKFSIIVREVNKNAAVLAKMPNGEMFVDTKVFFKRLISGYAFEYMGEIYKYIDLANLIDTYKHYEELYKQYESELKVYQSKAESIDALQKEIDNIDRTISALKDKIDPINIEIADRSKDIAILQELEGIYIAILDNMEKLKPISQKIQDCRNKLSENSRKINEINVAIMRSTEYKKTIDQIGFTLTPLMKDRDRLVHSVQLMQDYQKELEELKANYDFIETIKYYSSPTTGIQLVFMELYMGKIIALANELLKLLFQGKFVIQPFVINESEFRIPCLGEGYLNDDISSMSSSQIGMISMILSFALLHHSSTKYNIIKLDEIDGPLDYSNRLYFMDVLNSIMDIMNTEQCIMISHNSELQVDNSDVILLKHDENNMDYQRGNIIWSY